MSLVSAVLGVGRLYSLLFRSKDEEHRFNSIRRYSGSLIGFGLLIFAAVRMKYWHGDDQTLFAMSLLVLLASATWVSWELLLRIARSSKPDPARPLSPDKSDR